MIVSSKPLGRTSSRNYAVEELGTSYSCCKYFVTVKTLKIK